MTSVDIGGHPTWLTTTGAAPTVLLLHGGLSNSDELSASIGGFLGERFVMAAFDESDRVQRVKASRNACGGAQ